MGQFTYKTSHHGMFSDGKFSDRDGIFRDGRFCDGTFCMGTVVTVLTMGVQRNETVSIKGVQSWVRVYCSD